jgi:tRNA G18 (ribose-2'-O)-methylase SpoU
MKLNADQELVCGINTVKEIISVRPKSVVALFLQTKKTGGRLQQLSDLAKKNKIDLTDQDDSFFEENFSE